MGKLTNLQRKTLKALLAKDGWVCSQGYGLNAGDFGGKRAAASARGMVERGWVGVKQYSAGHFRYHVTDAGRQALTGEPG